MTRDPLSVRTRFLNVLRRFWMLPGLEGVAAALFGGVTQGSLRSRFLPNHYQFPPSSSRSVTTAEGLRFKVDVGTLLGWVLRFDLRDPALEVYFGLMGPGMTVVDVGANLGFTALEAARRVGDAGTVWAFEPHPDNYAELRRNVALNPALDVRTFELGLGRASAELPMVQPTARNPGTFRIGRGESGVAVRLDSLDEVVEREGLQRVDLLKIDTEGFEEDVLLGARQTLARDRPTIFLELDQSGLRAQGSSVGSVLALLTHLGYRVRRALTGALMEPEDDYEGLHCDGVAEADADAGTDP